MAKRIKVNPEIRECLKKEFELSNDVTVYNALNFTTDSPSAKMIRRRALELGGVEWHTADEPACSAENNDQIEMAHIPEMEEANA